MVQRWVKDLTESALGGAPFEIGDVVMHPDGYKVKITGGQYWGTHGLSNCWTWKKVLKNGKLSKDEYSGYGWRPEPPKKKLPAPRKKK